MSSLPRFTILDYLRILRPVERAVDEGTYVRCDHQGGGTSYWRFLRPETLVRSGYYKPWRWVVQLDAGPGIPREGYPIDDSVVPPAVRDLRSAP